MAEQPAFKAELFQNPYLPSGGTVVDAVVTVTASGDGVVAGGPAPTFAQVIMIDCSGSMTSPYTKLTEAKRATVAAIDTLRDGVPFAIVAGRGRADMVFPASVQLVPANLETREEAKAAVNRLNGSGGTAMGTWLTLANHLFARSTAEVKHAIMLTDGENQHETAEQLAMVLQACQGRFVCDTRGVGEGWKGTELLRIASALLGSADALEQPSMLAADFKAMTEKAMGKSIAEVNLRLWTPAGSSVRFVKQAWPHMEDLTGRRRDVSARIGDYPTGAWGAEHRDYHVSIQVPANAVGEEMLAGRVSLVAGDQVLAQSLILANWTDDMALSTQINPRVAHYTGQAELAEAIQEGLAARDAGDVDKATAKLGRAVQLAEESGHTDTAKLLGKVVDVVDAKQGTVRLKQKVEGVDAELASVRSVKTVRVQGT
jgi:hypothetical protein